MKTPLRSKGDEGEKIALNYLLKKGYLFLDKNWQCRYGEIDLIMFNPKKELVFIEVKLRTSSDYGNPEEMVTFRKQKSLLKTANRYIQMKSCEDYFFRFDTIAITGTQNHYEIAHFMDTIREEY